MDEEQKMVRDIKGLDSDMQTLVYENYNKFISATDTIRKVMLAHVTTKHLMLECLVSSRHR